MASNEMTAADRAILAQPHWRETLTREARAAFLRTNTNSDAVKTAFHRLMAGVPREDGAAALEAMRRVIRVMGAFASLSHAQKQVLSGFVLSGMRGIVPAYSDREEHTRQLEAIYQSSPDLTAYLAELEADAALLAERQRQTQKAQQADFDAKQQREAEAPAIVAGMAKRGVRLEVVDGRVRAFPRSLLKPDDLAALASHAVELPAAIAAEWV